jgi:glycine hydroxymethyltransferase
MNNLASGAFFVADTVDATKPFFVGRESFAKLPALPALPEWEYKPEPSLKKTVLHGWHAQQKAKLIPFGGWDMPVEYPSGIFKEHAAVRAAAGLFDVSHMSALEVSGPNALPFLEVVFANAASRLINNEAQYSYMLRETGQALDDLYVYRINREKFMVVVNAGNFEQDWSWLTAVNEGRVRIDTGKQGVHVPKCTLTNLRDVGGHSLIDLAFQGPLSLPMLVELAQNDRERAELLGGKLNDIHHIHVGGIPVRAARTGYTGEEIGYELFVHPSKAQTLWELLLEKGESRGVRAIGLGARDSLRTEAGFPLFGHELEGPASLSLTEADYGFVSRFHRSFYIGRDKYIERLNPRRQRLVRVTGQGRRMVRPGHAIIDASGKAVGSVTSAAFVDTNFNFYALAAVNTDFHPNSGEKIRAYRTAPEKVDKVVDNSKVVDLNVLTRFPTAQEKSAWKSLYARYMQ